ncbi:di-trans,poly-cis-decaprenylcistransferase [Candidatus Gottesmanbacteria bacterium RIFOXYB1_FULL_47_11]|uniref:Isoprenyl transferase n=1 Tax=Candidatus Gottesmanbacteria bacterium RIFOXYB1_FULL_47_11 TaxID=1798401 RepID=A0A1F6BDH8_9BACT|nr:MAG: di-trans,poly-cis-decaprenylcistransferase [Candidatus Gottesmanbacteria bacterium RIFOXYB1_FULL_47_11]
MIPTHIAVVMDGNRRWAKEHRLPILEGHRRVANRVLEQLVAHAADRGINYMTFWAFSTENWGRAQSEVKGIMYILKQGLGPFGRKMMAKGVRLKVIGDLSRIDPELRTSIGDVVEKTKNNTKITVTIALNYGGRDEIRRAVRRAKNKNDFEKYLDTHGIPDPDFIIRTGGEQRLSGFLLWQGQYSELYFPEFLMPDFTPARLDAAIEEFEKRKRRFGV